MSRHSKNNTANSVFTYQERQRLKYGTISDRLGADSIKEFDSCCICLHSLKEPMCCSKGHVFCKECIYEFLLSQKKEIGRQLELYEEQQKKLKEEEDRKEFERKQKEIEHFDKTVIGIGVASTNRTTTHKSTDSKSLPSSDAVVVHTPSSEKRANPSSDDVPQPEKKAKLAAFWVPGVMSVAAPTLLKRPSADTKCPDGNHNIKLKQLVPLKFSPNKSGGESLYECAVCSKTFTKAIKASAIKKCGHVVCHTCMGPIKKDCSCPICSVSFKEGDVISLSTGGTGYAGSLGEKLKATVVTPSAWL